MFCGRLYQSKLEFWIFSREWTLLYETSERAQVLIINLYIFNQHITTLWFSKWLSESSKSRAKKQQLSRWFCSLLCYASSWTLPCPKNNLMSFPQFAKVRAVGLSSISNPCDGLWRSFDVFFDLRLNKRLSKQWGRWWFETPSYSLWHHCYSLITFSPWCYFKYCINFHGDIFILIQTEYADLRALWYLLAKINKNSQSRNGPFE